MKKVSFRNYKNFTKKEFTCRCGCGTCNPSKKLMDMLQRARNYAKLSCMVLHEEDSSYPTDVAFEIERGSSCQKHNDSLENSSPTSSHIASEKKQSTAVDIKCHSNRERFIIISSLIHAGFNRIGLYKSHNGIHADCDETKSVGVIWLV